MTRSPPLLDVRELNKQFGTSDGDRLLPGCHGVSLTLEAGQTIGIVGESGSGKTTLGRCIAGLLGIDSGDLRIAGEDVWRLKGAARRQARRRVQIVFQNPETSLNPRMTAARFVIEAMRNFGTVPRAGETARLEELGGLVGLDPGQLARYPHELSGGQKQRVGLMRALACEPEIIVLDEPTSALDVSVQAQVLTTLRALQQRTSVGFVLISHDIGVIRQMCSQVFVMYLGRIVERGDTAAVLSAPRHPYTRALIGAVPRVGGGIPDSFELSGDATFRNVARSSCPLLPRCPLAVAQCRALPPLAAVAPGHDAACWRTAAGATLPEAMSLGRREPVTAAYPPAARINQEGEQK